MKTTSSQAKVFIDGLGGIAVIYCDEKITKICKRDCVYDLFEPMLTLAKGIYITSLNTWHDADWSGDGETLLAEVQSWQTPSLNSSVIELTDRPNEHCSANLR